MNCEGRHYLAKKKLLFKQNNDPVDILIISKDKINDTKIVQTQTTTNYTMEKKFANDGEWKLRLMAI